MHHLKIDATTWVNHNSDWSGDVQVCWDGREAWIPGSVIVAAGKAQADAETLSLLRRLTTETRVMIGNKEKVYFAVLRAVEDAEALLKRLGE